MDCNDEDRSLRRITLRLLSEDEDQAQEEIDKIIQGVEAQVGRQSTMHTWSVPAILIIPAAFLATSIPVMLVSKWAANILFGFAILACLVPLFMSWHWHRFQYGNGRLRKPREPIYADASDETRATLEKLFAYLQRDSAPRAYYRNRHGVTCYLERRYSFGSLRVLLLSDFAAVRELCLTPSGGRISEAIRIEADPDEVIRALKIKPKRAGGPGRNVKYRYGEAIIALIGDPRLDTLDLTDRATAIRTVKNWLSEWFDANVDESGDMPRRDQLTSYAEKICTHLEKIASAKAR